MYHHMNNSVYYYLYVFISLSCPRYFPNDN
jgi:hypothetical protein